MKKKLLISALFAIVVLLCSFGLIGCTSENDDRSIDGDTTHTHQWSDWTSDGATTHTRSCACGESETKNHNWDTGVETKQATCKDTGIMTYTCSDCGETKTETIEKTAHSWSNWTSLDETVHSRYCYVCKDTETEKHTISGSACKYCDFTYKPATITSVENGNVDNSTFSVNIVVDKMTDSINLSNIIKVSDNSLWKLYTTDSTLIATKFANNLKTKENYFLIVVSSTDGVYENTYTLNIYKSFEVNLLYYNNNNLLIYTEIVNTGYEHTLNYTPSVTGYTFNYWTMNGEKITEFIPYAETNLYADCTVNEYTFTLNADGGEVTETTKQITFDSPYSLPIPTKTGYTFKGWYKNDTLLTDIYGESLTICNIAENTEILAKWQINTYSVNVTSNNTSYGNVTGNGNYNFNTIVNVTATTEIGCTFIGWFDGETLIDKNLTHTFTMPDKNLSLTAKWCKVTTNCVTLKETYVTGETVSLTFSSLTPSKYATIFIGWFMGTNKTFLTDDLTYDLIMPAEDLTISAEWRTIYLSSNNENYGTISPISQTYKLNDLINFTAITKPGCTFIGWFDSAGNKLSNDLIYITKAPNYSDYYSAHWCKTYISSDDTSAGQTLPLQDIYKVGDNAEITAIPHLGYDFIGWYNKDTLYSTDITCQITMADKDDTYIAKWKVCDELQNFEFSSTLNTCKIISLKDKTLSEITIPEFVTEIGDNVFSNCGNITNITIPDNVIRIGENAFQNCYNLTNVSLPTSLLSIGDLAFCMCRGLTHITLPDSVQSIGNYAFYACTGLTSINIPIGITKIDGVFFNCNELTSIVIPNGVTSIGNDAFCGCVNLTSIYIPNTVTNIGDYAFASCKSLKNIIIPDTVNFLGERAFSACTELTNCKLPNSLTYISNGTFEECNALVDISLPNEISHIGEYAFKNCYNLTNITLSTNLISIGDFAFYGCTGLTSIIIPIGVTSIGQYAFDYTQIIYCEIASKPTNWNQEWNNGHDINLGNPLETFYMPVIWDCKNNNTDANGYEYQTIDGITYQLKDGLATVWCQPGTLLGDICIPKTVTYGNTYNVTCICSFAFFGYNIGKTSIIIPDSIIKIENFAFYQCANVTIIYCEAAEKPDDWMRYWNCNSLENKSFLTVIYDYKNNI